MTTKPAQTDPIHIGPGEHERRVVLRPESNDLFVRTGRQVIADCHLGISIDLWMSELDGMLNHVSGWAEQHAGQVRQCYCAPRATKTALFFVPTADRFDFDLADELAVLNGVLVRGFNVGMVEIHQVPGDELERFVDLRTVRQIYGEPPEPHPAVAT